MKRALLLDLAFLPFVLRLPEPLRTNALLAGGARAFLSDRLGPSHGWIELPYDSELAQLGDRVLGFRVGELGEDGGQFAPGG